MSVNWFFINFRIIKRILLISILLSVLSGYSQKVRTNAFNREYQKYRTTTDFDIIHEGYDSLKLTWVADLTVKFDTIIPGMIYECFTALKDKANKLGANGFKVKDSDIISNGDAKFIKVSTFWIRMEDRDENTQLFRSNKVYLFGLLGFHQQIDGYEVTVSDKHYKANKEVLVRSLTYREYELQPDDKMHIRLGGKSRGASTSVHAHKKMMPKFFYFHMLKGSFKNAWIDEYSKDFGHFLINILTYEDD